MRSMYVFTFELLISYELHLFAQGSLRALSPLI
jgi:hypothetical protein